MHHRRKTQWRYVYESSWLLLVTCRLYRSHAFAEVSCDGNKDIQEKREEMKEKEENIQF